MEELEPCPFCPDGGKPKLIPLTTDKNQGAKAKRIVGRYVQCLECGCKTKTFKIKDFNKLVDCVGEIETKAIEAWNTRAEQTCENCVFDGIYSNNCSFCNRDPRLDDQFIAKVVE